MIVQQTEIFLAFMVFIRASVLISFMPMFGGKVVPMQLKVALAGGIALLLFPLVPSQIEVPTHVVGLFIAMFKEVLIGALLGFAARMIFFVAEFAGTLISTESSLMRSDSFDPMLQSQSTTVSSLFFYLVALLILLTGTHYKILETFVFSYQVVPIGATFPVFQGVEAFARATGEVFLLGLKIAAPVVALGFTINMTFAVLGKAVPKMNVFMVSFSVRIMAGLSLLLMTLALIVQYFYGYVLKIPAKMLEFITF